PLRGWRLILRPHCTRCGPASGHPLFPTNGSTLLARPVGRRAGARVLPGTGAASCISTIRPPLEDAPMKYGSCWTRRPFRSGAAALAAAAMLGAALPLGRARAQDTTQTGSVAGRVTDEQGAPLASVQVFVE